jgi:hypothetical protein
MMIRYFASLLLATMFLCGCQKEDGHVINPLAANVTGSTTTPGNTTTPVTTTSTTYQPITANSYWKYANSITNDTSLITMTGTTSTINNQAYNAATSVAKSTGTTTTYFLVANHSYSTRSTASGITVETNYLIDTAAIGSKWTTKANDAGTIAGVPAQNVTYMVAKGLTKTVAGQTYTNVIKTTVHLQYNYGLGNGFEDSSVYDCYIAQGIGIIETDTDFYYFGVKQGSSTSILINYSIK